MAGLQGRAFGGYQLTEQLNSGGIAEAYRAQPAKPGGREVVVKVIYPEFARQPGFIPHFRKIVQMSGKLASHPHILPLLAHGEENGYLYLVTPYVAAGTLRDWMQKGGRLGATDVGPFFRQLGDALSYAHSLGVIHGNMKPSNVFLFEGRHVLLGDFGMLWDISHMDMNHAGSGTEAVEYLAPEVANGQVTQLGDVYSVGT
ncbi:MAG: serine/threonine protein kinase, partial [Ktedonobacterales bacterium]